jgi:hypothetical protein
MTVLGRSWSASTPRGPWFRQRPAIAFVVAGVLYAAVLALTVFAGEPADDYVLLYVFPVALISIAFGLRAGVMAGLTALVMIVLWVALRDISLTATGWTSRALPLLLLGGLVGRASDRLREAEMERRQLEAAALLQRDAVEINDSLVQGMAAARWSLQAGQMDTGLRILDETLEQGQEMVSDLIRRAGMNPNTLDV